MHTSYVCGEKGLHNLTIAHSQNLPIKKTPKLLVEYSLLLLLHWEHLPQLRKWLSPVIVQQCAPSDTRPIVLQPQFFLRLKKGICSLLRFCFYPFIVRVKIMLILTFQFSKLKFEFPQAMIYDIFIIIQFKMFSNPQFYMFFNSMLFSGIFLVFKTYKNYLYIIYQ